MVEKREIDDLIVFGKTVPSEIHDGRATVCTAGYSQELGLIRLYPTTVFSPLKRWNIVSVPVEKDKQDSRFESWKIQGSKREWTQLHKKIEVVGKLTSSKREKLISSLVDECVLDLNDERRSLGIVKPIIEKCYFKEEPNYDPTTQMELFGGFKPTTKRQYPVVPRIRYRCTDCKTRTHHDQQVLEWGFFEWMRKNPNNIEQVWDNVRIHSDDREKYFFVGNQRNQRTSFMIISVLTFQK
ncbi:MAG: hypothetical protein ACTSWQ_03425 [Candidatus Thorarchaeota archaeon]